ACHAKGIPPTDDFNGGDNEGVSYFHVNQRKGWRASTNFAFLKPINKRPNLRIVTEAMVTGLTMVGRKVTAVEGTCQGRPFKAAGAETILSAGAVNTPKLLMLCGIGPGDALNSHGIAVRHEMRDVGKNLSDHLQLRLAFKVSGVRTLNTRSATLWGKAKIAAEYAAFRKGPLAAAPSQLGAFTRSHPSKATPDLEYHVQPLSLDAFGQPLHDFDAFTASVCDLRPTSRGEVTLASADPRDAPLISPNYLSTEEDRRTAARAIRLTRDIVAQEPLARFQPEEFKPGPVGDTDEDLAKAAGDIGTTIFHPSGTCRLGVDDHAVVDGELRVKGLSGLRICDTSIMPTIPSGNTAAPTMMAAEKCADMILNGR
ncbi:MAG: GMC oxidoreductase, partial [Pseudomonadota bacterium]